MECACGEVASRLAKREAKAISVFGKISYQRQYYLCRTCGQGQGPLDQRLGLEPGQVTPGLKRARARWTETGALHAAKARTAWLSGDSDILAAQRAALPPAG